MAGVFQNIDPPPPHRPASVYPPPVGGHYIARHSSLLTYVSTLWGQVFLELMNTWSTPLSMLTMSDPLDLASASRAFFFSRYLQKVQNLLQKRISIEQRAFLLLSVPTPSQTPSSANKAIMATSIFILVFFSLRCKKFFFFFFFFYRIEYVYLSSNYYDYNREKNFVETCYLSSLRPTSLLCSQPLVQ